MKQKRFLLLLFVCLSVMILSGCGDSVDSYTAPPENLEIKDSLKEDLKSYDLSKITKKRLQNIDGVSLENYGDAYEVQYRGFKNDFILVRVLKFDSEKAEREFLKEWNKAVIPEVSPEVKENGARVFSYENKQYKAKAWTKNLWLTIVSVPLEMPKTQLILDQVCYEVNEIYRDL